MRIKNLQILQAGTNPSSDTYGTTVAPTVKLMGIESVSMKPMLEVTMFDERLGTLAPGYNSEITKEHAEVDIEARGLYEDLPYYLDSVFGQATPTTDINGGVYLYEAPLTDVAADYPAIRELDLVYGEEAALATDAAGVPGFIGKNITISCEVGGAWHIAENGMGTKVETDEIDTSLADRTINTIMAQHTNLYIGAASDYSGGASDVSSDCGLTLLSDIAFSFNLNAESNRALVWHLDSITANGHRPAKWDGKLSLSIEMDSTTYAYFTSIIGASSVFDKTVRIEGISGNLAAILDFHGVSLSAPEVFTDTDGVITVELGLTGQYDATMGNWLKARVNSAVESLA